MKVEDVIKDTTERIQKTASVTAVFGDPIKHGDSVIIPVAKTKVAGGGGSGQEEKKGSGMGMGLSVMTSPVGYIIAKDDKAEFVEIIDTTTLTIARMVTILGSLFVVSRIAKRYFKIYQQERLL